MVSLWNPGCPGNHPTSDFQVPEWRSRVIVSFVFRTVTQIFLPLALITLSNTYMKCFRIPFVWYFTLGKGTIKGHHAEEWGWRKNLRAGWPNAMPPHGLYNPENPQWRVRHALADTAEKFESTLGSVLLLLQASFFKKRFVFVFINTCVCSPARPPEDSVRSPGAEVTGSCEPIARSDHQLHSEFLANLS